MTRARATTLPVLLALFAVPHATTLVAQGNGDASRSSRVRAAAYEAQQAGRFAEAAASFLKLHDLEPSQPRWVIEAGDALGKAGELDRALQLLEEAKSEFPAEIELQVLFARTLHLFADREAASGGATTGLAGAVTRSYYRDAASVASGVLQAAPDHLEARLLLAQAHFKLGELDEAIAAATTATEQHPDAAGGYVILGQSRFYQYRTRQNELAREQPRDPARRKELEDGIEEARAASQSALERAAAIDPDRSIAFLRLGDLAGWSGNPEAALDNYGRAIGVDPRSIGQVDLDWLRGAVGLEKVCDMWAAARERYARRAQKDPVSLALLDFYRGRACYDAGRFDEARSSFEKAVKLADEQPEFLPGLYWTMRAAYWQNDRSAAMRAALEYARRSPEGFADAIRSDDEVSATSIVQFLADRAFSENDLANSRDLNQVLALLRDSAEAWNNYAFLCRETGKFEDAWRGYERALRVERSPQILNDGALILQYHLPTPTNLQKARTMYEEAIALAQKQLAEGGMPRDEIARTRTALRDARANLAKLPKDG
jgi:tetratricopeptide (TPR) repeat protein